MSDRESPRDINEMESGEFEIESEDLGDIEAAMREALNSGRECRGLPRSRSRKGSKWYAVGSGVSGQGRSATAPVQARRWSQLRAEVRRSPRPVGEKPG